MDEKTFYNNALVFLKSIKMDGTNTQTLRALADVLDHADAKLKALLEAEAPAAE